MATKPMVFLKNIDFSYLWLVWPASTHCGQVKTLKEHQLLVEKAKAKNVLLQIEVENLDIFEHWQRIISNSVLACFQFYILTFELLSGLTTITLMFVIAMIIIFWLFHVFSRCTRGSIRSTVTRGWEFRNLVRFCAVIFSRRVCIKNIIIVIAIIIVFIIIHLLVHQTGHVNACHNQWTQLCRRVQFLHQLHEPTKVPAGDVQGQYWVQILRSPHYFHHEKGDCFKTWFCWRSGLGRTWKWHLLLSQQPPHRSTCLGHAG